MSRIDDQPLDITLGLPGPLPPGERVLWHGRPDRRSLARHAFGVRGIAIYLLILAAFPFLEALTSGGGMARAVPSTVLFLLATAPLLGFFWLGAWITARTTRYVVTDRRVIMLIGVAVTKMVNLPLREITHAEVRDHTDGTRDLALTLRPPTKVSYLALWPHTRFTRLREPTPTLRSLPQEEPVAEVLAPALMAAAPGLRFGTETDAPHADGVANVPRTA